MIILGLTGSIGMGKSTTARMFAEEGVPVHDADETVHRLYAGPAAPLIKRAFPGTVSGGAVDRKKLSAIVLDRPELLRQLGQIIHPLVRARDKAFLDAERDRGAPLVQLDIPLLYETGGEARVDKVVVVTCAPEIQRQRVLARPGMTEEKFRLILARQMPDAEKRRRADFLIDTGGGLDAAREQVEEFVERLKGREG